MTNVLMSWKFLTTWHTFYVLTHDMFVTLWRTFLSWWRIFVIISGTKYNVNVISILWQICWCYDMLWCHDKMFDVMTCFWLHDKRFDVVAYFLFYDKLFTSWRIYIFDLMTCGLMTNHLTRFLSSWHNFSLFWEQNIIKTCFWCHNKLFDVFLLYF